MICNSAQHKELKWVAGMFYWIDSVQGYESDDGWDYVTALHAFVDGGMTDDGFINSVSGIVYVMLFSILDCLSAQTQIASV